VKNWYRTSHRCRSKKLFGGGKNFCPNFPKHDQKVSSNFCGQFFGVTSKKMAFICLPTNIARPFSPDLQGFCLDNWGFCWDFQGFCPNSQQIKIFWGTLGPPPPTPLELSNQVNQCQRYWKSLLQRLISVVKFIAERGLTFRDDWNVGSPRNFFQAKFQKKKIRCFWWPILQHFHKSLNIVVAS